MNRNTGKPKWVKIEDDKPPFNTVVLGYNKNWIDEDYEPEGIRECFMWDDVDTWTSCVWNNERDTWSDDVVTKPTHWMRRPKPPTHVGATKFGFVHL